MASASGLRVGGGCLLLLQFPSTGASADRIRPQFIFGGGGGGAKSLSSGLWKGRVSAFSPSIGSDYLRPELDENPEGIISGEWPENFSLLSYDDLRYYLEAHASADDNKMGASSLLREVMSTPILTASAEQTLEEIDGYFEFVSGLPVVDGELRCVGVISGRDRDRATHGLKSRVGEVMSSPAITLSSDQTVKDAAALMLKMKIHRIPILNEARQVIGMVTRTDVFQALEALLEVV